MRIILTIIVMVLALPAGAVTLDKPFANIDGGTLKLSDWKGHPVLVVNTASHCGFTPQYKGLQALYDKYRDRGLIVLAVPSDDFNQELDSNAAVKDFCAVNYGLTLPMTGITHVTGPDAHPFYASVAKEKGFTPGWNFNKILLSPKGEVVATYGSMARPTSRRLTSKIEEMLK